MEEVGDREPQVNLQGGCEEAGAKGGEHAHGGQQRNPGQPMEPIFFFNDTATTEIYTLSLHDALPILSGGQFDCPIVFRGPNASARQVGSQHSHAMEHFYATIPGLKVVAPAFPADAKGLLKAAIRDDNPVLVMESETLYGVKGDVPDGDEVTPLGKAQISRPGTDVTIAAYS